MVLKSIYWIVFLSDCRTRRHVGCDASDVRSFLPQLTPIKSYTINIPGSSAEIQLHCLRGPLPISQEVVLDFLGHSLKMWMLSHL